MGLTADIDEINIEDSPYAEWLEGAIKTVLTFEPDSIGLVAARYVDGMAFTAYYNAGVRDKTEFIHHILSDEMMEVIENNADMIREIILGADEDEPDEDQEDDEWLDTQLR